MRRFRAPRVRLSIGLLLPLVLSIPAVSAFGQDRLRRMPGYERFQRIGLQIPSSVGSGAISAIWDDDGNAFRYQRGDDWYRWDVASRSATPIAAPGDADRRGRGPERGRQFDSAMSPDSTLRAFHRDRNLWISNADGSGERAITTDGDEAGRTKYGIASWVYGEELGQNTAMWWSPDGRRIAFYRFDESPVPDFFLQLDQTRVQSTLDIEAYPKAGVDNPIVALYVHDLQTGTTTQIDVRDGQPLSNDVVGHYVYRVSWSPDGTEILFNRTNRRQNIMEFTACSPETGSCRVIVREEWLPSWTTNSPRMQWLSDGRRFVWMSERTGFSNLYLYDISGKLLTTLTQHSFEVGGIVHVDEHTRRVWYTARSGDNHMKMQLHVVGLDGRGDRRLTDPAFNHTVSVAPDGRHFVDVAQTHDTPPVSSLLDARGRVVAELASSDLTKYAELGLKPVEMFRFTSADGETELHGMLHRPSNFDPSRRYPLLLSVYGGPNSPGARETFATPHPFTEYGFLMVTLNGRNSGGQGKRLLDSIYENLGVVEVDDMAAAVRALRERPYVDGEAVGIYGTSYGGYASILALLRYPDVFHAASASSPVTDWRHYDTIYTERYMWIPQENEAGYDAGSAMTYVDDLRGRLMIYYGTADNNVHPNNAMQLIDALQKAGKSFEVQVGPDRGHTAINSERMMEFFIENLVLRNGQATTD